MKLKGWEHFTHGADIGVRGWGPTREEAFEQTALSMTNVITDGAGVALKEKVEFHCSAPDEELLLADFLNAIVFEMATRNLLFGRFKVSLDGNRLRAEAWGEEVNRPRHQPAVEVKGATYTELRIFPDRERGWVAQCVVDV